SWSWPGTGGPSAVRRFLRQRVPEGRLRTPVPSERSIYCLAMRLPALLVALVLAAAPVASLPERPECCPMAGSGMACCRDGGHAGDGTCQLRSCSPDASTV